MKPIKKQQGVMGPRTALSATHLPRRIPFSKTLGAGIRDEFLGRCSNAGTHGGRVVTEEGYKDYELRRMPDCLNFNMGFLIACNS